MKFSLLINMKIFIFFIAEKFSCPAICLARQTLQLLVIRDLVVRKASYLAELSMKKVL